MKYVMIAVPAGLVQAVTEFIEGHDELGLEGGSGDSEFFNGWDPETIRRAYLESADRMRHLLRYLAENADEEVSSDQIARALEARYGWNTVAGMLGAFGRRSANRYGRREPMWKQRWDAQGRALLAMPYEVAKAVLEADRDV